MCLPSLTAKCFLQVRKEEEETREMEIQYNFILLSRALVSSRHQILGNNPSPQGCLSRAVESFTWGSNRSQLQGMH